MTGPSISVDATGGVQISYVLNDVAADGFSCSPAQSSIVIKRIAKLLTLIPGINSHGATLVKGATQLAQVDDESVLRICEAIRLNPNEYARSGDVQKCDLPARPSEDAIRSAVRTSFDRAVRRGKDLAVLVDMDLESYNVFTEYFFRPGRNRWRDRSVPWAAEVANIVSDEFHKLNPLGVRILYAHSAGVDAANVSVAQTPGVKMFDHLLVFNGRTNADNFRTNLQASNYEGWQVKVFTNVADAWGWPFTFNHSLSVASVVERLSGPNSWTAFYGSDIGLHPGLPNAIADGRSGTFQIQYGMNRLKTTNPVKTMVMNDWRALVAGE